MRLCGRSVLCLPLPADGELSGEDLRATNGGTLRSTGLADPLAGIVIPDGNPLANEILVALLIGTVSRDGDGVSITVGREAKAEFCS